MSVRERDLCATGKTRLVLEQNLSALVVHAGGVSSHGKSRVNSRLHLQMADQARTLCDARRRRRMRAVFRSLDRRRPTA